MSDAEDGRVDEQPPDSEGSDEESLRALRREVEEKYDFDDFGPEEMAEMSLEEWEAVFDPDTWITGRDLLDRVEKDLRSRIAYREVFAVIERIRRDGEDQLLVYSDEGYAVVHPDGGIEGEGTVLRDVKPTVALCSMEEYEVDDPPEDVSLPQPVDVAEGSGEFGNLMLQIVAGAQMLVGVGLLVVWLLFPVVNGLFGTALPTVGTIFAPLLAGVFLVIGFFLFLVVANARLSDRFRAEEYRNRLRAVGAEHGERPDFLPFDEEGAPRVEPRRDDDNATAEGKSEGS
ncbi:hypothetical protein SAMN04488063_0913 [Halopelagius inordinatus]|uniref:DUF7319 domain-containing protein n=1 Tax=Halopelagius inordinatus TaxID=553467 RepID=A0A1I2N1W2_9EURY|nr:hypothetical protein [Halopelagius inordinatus]SFF95526.1 hypothetical protein SAMN04488063_0913 [Halopelagius inordinatus]